VITNASKAASRSINPMSFYYFHGYMCLESEEQIMDNPSEVFVVIITIISLVVVFGTPIMVFYLFYLAKRRKLETIIKLVELGGELKPEMLAMLEPNKGPVTDLRAGLVWLAVGIPLTLGLLFSSGANTAVYGLIPILIGLAYLAMMKFGHSDAKGNQHGL